MAGAAGCRDRRGARFELSYALAPGQVDELMALYKGEWWTAERERGDVLRMLASTPVQVGLRETHTRELVAFARALTDGVYKALVFDVIVAPAFRDLGIGRTLMDALLDHPLLRGVNHVELYCLPELVPFYRRWGFSDDVGSVQLMRADRTGGS